MPTKIINNKPFTFFNYLSKLNEYGYLIKIIAVRELKIKYSKTILGISWVILQPLLVVMVYTLFFKNMLKLNTYDVPYPQYVLTGLVLWYLSTGIISKSIHALFESKELITKVSFPKLIILIAKICPVIIECLVLLILSVIAVLYTQHHISFNVITSLFYFVDVVVLSFSIGIICALLSLKYRDFLEIIPFVINFAIWLTPIFYAFASVPDNYKNIFRYCNPLIIPLEGMRDAFFGNVGITVEAFLIFIITLLLFILSCSVFAKFDKNISEKI